MIALDAAVDLDRVRAARAQDRPAAGQDAADLGDAQLRGEALERALPAVAEADELVAVLRHALADDGADDSVETGAVAATGEHSDAHGSPRAWGSGGGHDNAVMALAPSNRTGAAEATRPWKGLPCPQRPPEAGDDAHAATAGRTDARSARTKRRRACPRYRLRRCGPRASVAGHDLLDRGPLRGRLRARRRRGVEVPGRRAPPSPRPRWARAPSRPRRWPTSPTARAASRCSPPAVTPATSSPRYCPRTTRTSTARRASSTPAAGPRRSPVRRASRGPVAPAA